MTSIAFDRRTGLVSSAAFKGPCKAATTANINLNGEQTIDGVSVVDGDRVLVKDQTDARNNGIWVVSTGNWQRAPDFRDNNDVVSGTMVAIASGTLSGNAIFSVQNSGDIVIGTTLLSLFRAVATAAQGEKADNAVQFVSQSLTTAQKKQSRTNIGAAATAYLATNVVELGADNTGASATSTAFQAAYDATSVGDPIVVPDGTYQVPSITGTDHRYWIVYGLLTSGNFADYLPGTVVQPGMFTPSGGPTIISELKNGSVPTTTSNANVDILRSYYRSYWQGGSGGGRLNGFHLITDVQAGASGIHQIGTFEINVTGQPGTTTGNGNYVAQQSLATASAAASSGGVPDSLFGGNDYVLVNGGATGWLHSCGREIDNNINATVTYNTGLEVAKYGSANGSSVDYALHADSWSSAPWKGGFLAGGMASSFAALATTASFLKASVSAGIAYGLDLYGTPISGSYLRGNDIDLLSGEAQFSKAAQVVKIGNPTTASSTFIYGYSSGGGVSFPDSRITFSGGTAGTAWVGNLSLKAGVVLADTTLIRPATDNVCDFGTASFRIKQYYGVNTAISSSDERLKKLRGGFTDTELDAIGEVQLIIFQWLDSVAEKGDEARLHAGVIAQRVDEAFTNHGISASNFGLWCSDPLYEFVDEEYEEAEPVLEDYTVEEESYSIVDGKAVVTFENVTKQRQKMEEYPLFDAGGNPVMSIAKPARPAREIKDDDGNVIGMTEAVEAMPSVQVTYSVPVTSTVTKTRQVNKPVLDENGTQKTILGIRYEQFTVMRQAWLERELSKAQARIEALEQGTSK
ncbi:tail fiber domain-containing protein [Agrobacterium vitis]|uniref:tail fiber domain-containing protein n=1 Tax=Agrobacterium vitis TaxID=373 RepID=UPI00403E4CF1